MARVIECTSNSDYIAAIGSAGDYLIIAEFCADWTVPSQVISNEIGTLRLSYPDLIHLRINFDICPEVFQKYRVSVLPCVKLIKSGEELGEVKGASFYKIKELVDEHY